MPEAPTLQSAVDRFAKSLAVPHGLSKLHERKKHRPRQEFMALAPAMVLTTVSAFEGFVEEFIAVVGAKRGLSFAQIAKLAHTNSPSLREFESSLVSQLGSWSAPDRRTSWTVEVWKAPDLRGSSNWWKVEELSWFKAVEQVDGWLQVRHSLSHGLTRGYLSENWPGPMKSGVSASQVLREQKNNRHSLSLHGAITCARLLRYCSEALCTQAALKLEEKPPRWRAVPAFPLEADE